MGLSGRLLLFLSLLVGLMAWERALVTLSISLLVLRANGHPESASQDCTEFLASIHTRELELAFPLTPFYVDGMCTSTVQDVNAFRSVLPEWRGYFFAGGDPSAVPAMRKLVTHSHNKESVPVRVFLLCLGSGDKEQLDKEPSSRTELYEPLAAGDAGLLATRRTIAAGTFDATLGQMVHGPASPTLVRVSAGHHDLTETLDRLLERHTPKLLWLAGLSAFPEDAIEDLTSRMDGYDYTPIGCKGMFAYAHSSSAPARVLPMRFFTEISDAGWPNVVFPRFACVGSSTTIDLIDRHLEQTHSVADAMLIDEFLRQRRNGGHSFYGPDFRDKPFSSLDHDVLEHFASWIHNDALPNRTLTLLLIRNPLERELSGFYSGCRYGTGGVGGVYEAGSSAVAKSNYSSKGEPIDELREQGVFGNMTTMQQYADCLKYNVQFAREMVTTNGNTYAKWLGGSDDAVSPSQQLEFALKAIDKVSMIGLTERYDEFIVGLAELFGWPISSCLYFRERSQDRKRLAELRPAFPELFAELDGLLAVDNKIYEKAERRQVAWTSDRGADFQRDVAHFKAQNAAFQQQHAGSYECFQGTCFSGSGGGKVFGGQTSPETPKRTDLIRREVRKVGHMLKIELNEMPLTPAALADVLSD
jgi:hypothetical protein